MNGGSFISKIALEAANARKERHARIAAQAAALAAAKTVAVPRPVIVADQAQEWGRDPCDSWFEILFGQPNKKLTIDEIQRAVCRYFGLEKGDMKTARRTGALIRPRQIAMHLCKVLTQKSLPEIGRHFGGRDHTTILYGCRKVEELRAKDPNFASVVACLRAQLEGSL